MADVAVCRWERVTWRERVVHLNEPNNNFLLWLFAHLGLSSHSTCISFLLWEMLLLQNNNYRGFVCCSFSYPCSYPVFFFLTWFLFSPFCCAWWTRARPKCPTQRYLHFPSYFTAVYFTVTVLYFFSIEFSFLHIPSYPARSNFMAEINIDLQ